MSAIVGKEILMIDDDPEALLLARRIIEADGGSFTGVQSVEAAIASLQSRVPHLIITDLGIPGINGFDFLAKRKALSVLQRIPVIVLSGLKDAVAVNKAITLGASDYIVKPFRATILLQKVRKALLLNHFDRYWFPEGQEPAATIVFDAEIHMVNDTGFAIKAPVKLGTEAEIGVESLLLEEMGCSDVMTRTTRMPARFAGPGRYVSDVNFVGIGEKVAKQIREVLRKLRH